MNKTLWDNWDSIRPDLEYTVLNSVTWRNAFSISIVEQLDYKIVPCVYL